MLIISVQNNLKENIELLRQLSHEEYTFQNPILSNATIGEHIRHIIELFGCLLDNYDYGLINYDNRNRDILLQTNKNEAITALEKYLNLIDKPNKTLLLEQNCFGPKEEIQTNYYRELVYNIEHSIHHQALIKVALHGKQHIKTSNSFGIAPSTIEYRKQCAQ